ncbi:MAG: FAD-dependent oxidoreductase [Candidatus Nanohaloarchaea archaeon]|nr:FAD-dependent oxidoreductase [Candidatus Nanohaloarchaea archaeon]
MQYLVVGDGVAGHTAAETIRGEDEDADIRVFTDEDVPFYDRIGLRDYIRGGRTEEELVLEDEDWYDDRDIALHLGTEIVGIDPDAHTVVTADGDEYSYDKLLLAVGGRPRTVPMEEGVGKVHHLWTLDGHGRGLRRDLQAAGDGVVIGGGLLGFDLIGSFNEAVDATYLVREDRWWHSVLTPAGARIVHDAMEQHGVELRLQEECTGMESRDGQVRLTTNTTVHETDVVGIAVGHERNLGLARDAGLETGRGIRCDGTLQTSDPDIYVAGDAAEYYDPVLERRNLGGSWITAQEQGAVAGRNMAGDSEQLDFVDTYTVTHFGLNVASLGDPAETDGTILTAVDEEAGTYRKVVVEDGRIVGAAIIGAMQWMHPLKQLIRQKVDVSGAVDDLEDAGFDPADLL